MDIATALGKFGARVSVVRSLSADGAARSYKDVPYVGNGSLGNNWAIALRKRSSVLFSLALFPAVVSSRSGK